MDQIHGTDSGEGLINESMLSTKEQKLKKKSYWSGFLWGIFWTILIIWLFK